MRLAILVCGFALIASPALADRGPSHMPAPSPDPMVLKSAPNAKKLTKAGAATVSAAAAKNRETSKQFDRQVNATQYQIQQEEKRLASQFAQIQKLRDAAIDKQDQKELERLQRVEQEVVKQYQKRVEHILTSAQSQIQATTVHINADGTQQTAKGQSAQPTAKKPTQASQQRSQPTRKSSNSRSRWFNWR